MSSLWNIWIMAALAVCFAVCVPGCASDKPTKPTKPAIVKRPPAPPPKPLTPEQIEA
jgi:hypothetical protein